MCRNRRDRRQNRGQVLFITARIYRGLPFAPRHSINRVILGILARAQNFYPVEICAFVFMGNHYHLIITGHSRHFSPFMNYVQGEIAKAIQKFIPVAYEGRVWEGRYKEQILLTAEDVLDKMAYIYLNPVKARLVEKAEQYPGLSSFKFLQRGDVEFLYKWVPSRELKALSPSYSKAEDLKLVKELFLKNPNDAILKIKPFAWTKSFNYNLSQEELTDRLILKVRENEQSLLTPTMGVHRLLHQGFRLDLKPKSKDRTPYLISYDKDLRKAAIQSYQNFCQECREIWKLLKKGIKVIWPQGAYRPYTRWGPLFAT